MPRVQNNFDTRSSLHSLRKSFSPSQSKSEVSDTDFKRLITENILNKYPQGGIELAHEVENFINSLSERNKKRFLRVVRAFELDKKRGNLDSFIGEIWSGGGMRAIAGSSAAVTLTTLSLLVGINTHTYIATSSGSIQAITRILKCKNSHNLNETIEAPYETFPMNRRNLEQWVNNLLRRSYKALTGKDIDIVRYKHIKEIGSTFDCVVAVPSNRTFPFNFLFPETFPILANLGKRYGINSDEFPVAEAIGATTYVPGLMFELNKKDFGAHFITDSHGLKHYLFDPGLPTYNRVPLDLAEEQVNQYLAGKIEKPGIFFSIDYKVPTRAEIKKLKKEGGIAPNHKSSNSINRITSTIIHAVDFTEWLLNNQAESRLKRLGLQRTLILAKCARINPFTKEIAVINTGELTTTPPHVRETVILGDIPTDDHKDSDETIIDQLFDAFVDQRYQEERREELSPYELILRDIHEVQKNRSSK